jgi:hypothetical protein
MGRTYECNRRLGDALIDLYVAWREECSAVQLAYEGWREASDDDREAAFAAYNAALDREERASDIYAALYPPGDPCSPAPCLTARVGRSKRRSSRITRARPRQGRRFEPSTPP